VYILSHLIVNQKIKRSKNEGGMQMFGLLKEARWRHSDFWSFVLARKKLQNDFERAK